LDLNASISLSARFLSNHALGFLVKISNAVHPISSAFETEFWIPHAMEMWKPI
jgi:hypothetical protein